ncbi:MAG: hypothetical protein KJN76_13960, partial [Eudoraea sp.]|nr:hypothetical protein [Eudoraea sp.]
MKIGMLILGVLLPLNWAIAQNASYTETLEYGPHDVGFKTIFTTDLSREDVPHADWSGKLYPKAIKSKGRRLPISIWYPAKATAAPLKYEHFVQLLRLDSEDQKSAATDSVARQVYLKQTNDLGGNGTFREEDLNGLLSLQTKSFLAANPVEGKFPLVVFPNGASPASQSILSEFLASHGYVVAAVPLKGRFSSVVETSVRGLESAVDDLQFVLQKLLTLENVDGNQIALMANAIESSYCAALISRNEKIKTLISLEGGFLSKFEQGILDKTSFYEPQNITVPILAIYAPHPSIQPERIFHLKYSERYFAHFPAMSEFHFLNYGLFEEFVPGIIGEAKGDTKKGFKAAADLSLLFLDAQFKDSKAALDAAFAAGATVFEKSVIDTLFLRPGIAAPPNITLLKDLFIKSGMTAIDSVYQAHLSPQHNTPFPENFYPDFRDWLAWKKDPDYVYRKALYDMGAN